MYRKPDPQISFNEDFHFFVVGPLNPDNQWVKLAKMIPWEEIEIKYSSLFPSPCGNVAKPVRMALGALIIQARCGYSDRETLEEIMENPYMQFFIGLKEFQTTPPFVASMMTHWRKRLGFETIQDINNLVCLSKKERTAPDNNKDDDNHGESSGRQNEEENVVEPGKNKGQLILDATCAPADIRYPRDLTLLNEAREKLEKMVDTLHKPMKGKTVKPRTYRKKARKAYLQVEKKKKVTTREIRRAIGKQLRYIKRDLNTIERMAQNSQACLSPRQQKELEVIKELFRQQKAMYDNRIHKIDNRIVSIHQPHVRPIVRGKAGAETEFGAKVALSLVDGLAFIENLSWDNFNEGNTLIQSVEAYRTRFGFYPESVAADKIYRNRENINYCKDKGIRLSGPRLGRPCEKEIAAQRKIERLDAAERNAIEGKFGEGKRFYGLGRIMARLRDTSETVIALQFMVMNLEKLLRDLLSHIFKVLFFNLEGAFAS